MLRICNANRHANYVVRQNSKLSRIAFLENGLADPGGYSKYSLTISFANQMLLVRKRRRINVDFDYYEPKGKCSDNPEALRKP